MNAQHMQPDGSGTAGGAPSSGQACETAPALSPGNVQTSGRENPPRRPFKRVIFLAVALISATVLFYLSPARQFVSDVERLRSIVRSLGPMGYPLCLLVMAMLVACGAPRLILAALGGMAFGFWTGLALSQGGALIGYYAVFLFVRWGGREWVLHHWPRLRKWSDLIAGQGVVGVVLVRQLPLHGTLTNLCFGVSNVRHVHFLIGSAIGLMPEAIPVTLAGAGLVRASVRDSAGYLAAAGIAFAGLWLAASHGLRVLKRTGRGAALMDEVSHMSEGANA